MNDLMSYLLNYASENDIGYILEQLPSEFESRALLDNRLIIINTNWYDTNELPFIVGHEIGHIMNGDNFEKCQPESAAYPLELTADKYSLRLIFNYAAGLDSMAHEPQTFMEQFGIPERMLLSTKELFKNNKELIL